MSQQTKLTQNLSDAEKSSDPDFSEDEVRHRVKQQPQKEQSPKKAEPKKDDFAGKNMPIKPPASNFRVRTIWTLCLLFGFMVIIASGQFYCMLLVLYVIKGMYSELLEIRRNKQKEQEIPFFNLLNWYFFGVAIYFGFAKFIFQKILRDHYFFVLQVLISKHYLISFMLWIIGFLMFVLSLKKGFYKYQFRQFSWIHVGCLLLVSQTSVITYNVYEGLVWFVLPCLLVIANDIFAYIFGFFLGKRKLIELSPKKTWEGFIGGFLSSVFFSIVLSYLFLQFDFMLCPQNSLGVIPLQFNSCVKQDYFNFKKYTVPSAIQSVIGIQNFYFADFQYHALWLSIFASIAAPFGGFFASGFKRALKIKDFGDTIPGHGGITDRFDCQILMGMFSYVYLNQIVLSNVPGVNDVIQSMSLLRPDDQLLLFRELEKILISKNILNATRILG